MTLPDPSILVRALTTDPPQIGPEDVPHLLAAGLAGQVRMRLPQDHPLRAALRPGQLALGARHALIRAEVRLLLAAWAREGIPAMLFKGFALAEFEYGTPGERFYGDVDVLIPEDPTTVMRAVHIAISHGWRSDGQHAAPERWTHESAHLFSPGGQVRLDVHRFAVGWVSGTQERVRRVTAALWAKAGAVDWAGVPVWRPDLVDAVVFNLALGRQWSGDVGGLKPADYADLQRLTARHALTGTQLAARAREVGATHTWAAFREACDPLERHFALGSPDVGPTLVRAVQRDGLLGRRAVWQRRLIRLPRLLRWLPRLLPDAFAAWWAVRSGGDPRVPLAPLDARVPPAPAGAGRGAGRCAGGGMADPAAVSPAVEGGDLRAARLHHLPGAAPPGPPGGVRQWGGPHVPGHSGARLGGGRARHHRRLRGAPQPRALSRGVSLSGRRALSLRGRVRGGPESVSLRLALLGLNPSADGSIRGNIEVRPRQLQRVFPRRAQHREVRQQRRDASCRPLPARHCERHARCLPERADPFGSGGVGRQTEGEQGRENRLPARTGQGQQEFAVDIVPNGLGQQVGAKRRTLSS